VPTDVRSEYLRMRVADVRRATGHPNPDACIVLLVETEGERRLPIWIGRAEAVPMALRLERAQVARPGAYDLTGGVVRALGGRVREVRVDRLHEGTFHATVVLDGPQGPVELDARPSDALNLALTDDVPIRVDRATAEEGVAHPDARAALERWPAGGARALLEELAGPPPVNE